jgi:hypothetical protein
MDKQTFLNLAPEYYMLAFFMHLQKDAEFYTDVGWRKDFSYYDVDAGKNYCFVERNALRSEAIRLMHKLGAITFIDDPFGPTIWQKTENLTALGDQLSNSPASVFLRLGAHPQGHCAPECARPRREDRPWNKRNRLQHELLEPISSLLKLMEHYLRGVVNVPLLFPPGPTSPWVELGVG